MQFAQKWRGRVSSGSTQNKPRSRIVHPLKTRYIVGGSVIEPPRDRRRVAILLFRDCTAFVLRRRGGDGGATAVLVRYHGGHGGAAAIPLRIGPTRGGIAEVLNMFKVSAVPPRRSAVLIVFRGATAINDGTTAEPRRPWRCHCGLCRTSTAIAPRLRCDETSTAEARRNMFKVAAVPPRRSAVLTFLPRCYDDR